MRDWKDIGFPWQEALNQAWIGYCEGGAPIGAVIVNAENKIVARAHNTICGVGKDNLISGHRLAHAELNALLKINELDGHQDIRSYKLYSTLEPCPLCIGAIVISHIRHFEFAAAEHLSGSVELIHATEYLKSKNIKVKGPIPGLESVVVSWLVCFNLECGRDKYNEYFKPDEAGYKAGISLYNNGYLNKLREKKAAVCDVYNFVKRLIEKSSRAQFRPEKLRKLRAETVCT
ncbi:MAG TPA: nucleoside deaminase [Clostridia bacterium]|nr:nucleoside deaminase [Clostridia bacterium]